MTAALVAAVARFVGRHAPAAPPRARPRRPTAPSPASSTSTPTDPTASSGARRDRRRGGARRAEVPRLHRSRRRHAHAGSAARTDRACCASTASRSAPAAGTTSRSTCRPSPYPLGGEAARRRRRRRAARRVRHRRASRFAEAGAALGRLDGAVRRRRAAQPRHQLARLGAAGRGWRAEAAPASPALLRLSVPPGRDRSRGLIQPSAALDAVGRARPAAAPGRPWPAPTRTRSSRREAPIPATAGSRCRCRATSRRSGAVDSRAGRTRRSRATPPRMRRLIVQAIRAGTSVHRGRRRRDAAGVRVHGDQRARHGAAGRRARRGGPVTLHVRSNAPPTSSTIVCDGGCGRSSTVRDESGRHGPAPATRRRSTGPRSCRRDPQPDRPGSGAIRSTCGRRSRPPTAPAAPPAHAESVADLRRPTDGGLDVSSTTRTSLAAVGCRADRRTEPSCGSGSVWPAGPSVGQYAALVARHCRTAPTPFDGDPRSASAPRQPMRISVQLRGRSKRRATAGSDRSTSTRSPQEHDGLLRRLARRSDRRTRQAASRHRAVSAASCSWSTRRTPRPGTSGRIWIEDVGARQAGSHDARQVLTVSIM